MRTMADVYPFLDRAGWALFSLAAAVAWLARKEVRVARYLFYAAVATFALRWFLWTMIWDQPR